jgi:LacI family transcriptional regulator
MNGRVTLSDIAKRAGVHVTTVSLALRNHSSLPESTRQRLKALAAEMGYRPDPALRALAAYRTRNAAKAKHSTLAYVTHWNTRFGWREAPAHADFHAGAERKARELGYDLDHFWVGEPGMTHSRLSDILYARGITGLILASHRREVDVPLQFDWSRFSAVKIDYFPHRPALHNVTNHQAGIIRLAMRQVRAAGYRRIGFVMHRGWDLSADHAWTAGYLCEQQFIPPEERVPICIFPEERPLEAWMPESREADSPYRSMFEIPTEMFASWYEHYKPEVVISKGSFIRAAAGELQLQVPEDFAFVDLFLDHTDGRTAGVRQNHAMVGELAIETLVGLLQQEKLGPPAVPTVTYVDGTWFDGASLPNVRSASERSEMLQA